MLWGPQRPKLLEKEGDSKQGLLISDVMVLICTFKDVFHSKVL